jgi:hypothetical protein
MCFLDDREQSIEMASEGIQSGGDNPDGVGNEQAEHRYPSNSRESIGLYIGRYSKAFTVSYRIAAIVHCMAQ